MHPLHKLRIFLEIRSHCLDCIIALGLHHRREERAANCWRQFSEAPARHEENSTSAREPFPALQRRLEGSVDSHSKVLCRFDHRDWGTISESQGSGRWLADGRWQYLLGLSGRCHVTDQSHAERRLLYCERGEIIMTSSAKSRTLLRSRSGRSLTNSRIRRGKI